MCRGLSGSEGVLSQPDNQITECGDVAEPESGAEPARRVLILGGGFGGIYAVLELERVLRRSSSVVIALVRECRLPRPSTAMTCGSVDEHGNCKPS
jgi:hypothetical protein